MRLTRRTVLAAGVGAGFGASAAPALRLGLAPFLSPAALLTVFRPLREQLAAALDQPVQAYTARDFRALADGLRTPAYDLALVPAHLARLSVLDWGWQPMAATVTETPVLLLARGSGPVRQPADLAGRRIGMLDLLSLTAAVGTRWIADQGLSADLSLLASINSALVALERDEVAAVVAAESQLHNLPPTTPVGQRVLARIGAIPGPQIVARPGLDNATLVRWRRALWAFKPDPALPVTAANSTLTPLTADLMAHVDHQAAYLRQQLGGR